MTKVLEQLFDLSQLLHLPRFLVTLRAVLLSPLGFFAHYREVVGIRRPKFSEVNAEAPDDPYMGPVKFAGLALLIENTLFPLGLSLGLAAGVVSPTSSSSPSGPNRPDTLIPSPGPGSGSSTTRSRTSSA